MRSCGFCVLAMRNARKPLIPKGLSLLKVLGISGFSYVANATTEPLGEVAFLNGRWANKEKNHFKFFTQNGLVIRV